MPDTPAAPAGWQAIGFIGNAGDSKKCKDGWNGYATLGNKGQLKAVLQGRGAATVMYTNCWSVGYAKAKPVLLYVNGVKKDQSESKTGNPRTYRCSGDAVPFSLQSLTCPRIPGA